MRRPAAVSDGSAPPSVARRQHRPARQDEPARARGSHRPGDLQAHPAEPAGDQISSVLSPADACRTSRSGRRRQAQRVAPALPQCDLILAIGRKQCLRQPLGRSRRGGARGIQIHQPAPEVGMLLRRRHGAHPRAPPGRPKPVQRRPAPRTGRRGSRTRNAAATVRQPHRASQVRLEHAKRQKGGVLVIRRQHHDAVYLAHGGRQPKRRLQTVDGRDLRG